MQSLALELPATTTTITMPRDWVGALYTLVTRAARDDMPTVDALLVDVAGGDLAGGVMLRRVIFWWSKLHREFYLSETDWWFQARLSRHVVARLKRDVLPGAGVLMTLKKAEGSPQTHYALNEALFLRRVSDALGLPMLLVASMMVQSGDGLTVLRQVDLPDSGKSLTDSTTKKNNRRLVGSHSVPLMNLSEQARMLVEMGVNAAEAALWDDLPVDVVAQCVREVQAKTNVRAPAKYLLGALRNQRQISQAKHDKNPFYGMSWSDFADTDTQTGGSV